MKPPSLEIHCGDSTGKVSVIIPTLSRDEQEDHFDQLRKLLSVYLPAQTYQNYEAIVYCDGRNLKVEKMVQAMENKKIRIFSTEKPHRLWGHPQTRAGIAPATGDYFVRMNDDNRPNRFYLEYLLRGFEPHLGLVYGRVIFAGKAAEAYKTCQRHSFLFPGRLEGTFQAGEIDCMNYMVRMELARQYAEYWDGHYDSDWRFAEMISKSGAGIRFVDKILGYKR